MSRAIFDRYNIIHEQELLDAGDQLVAYLAQHAQATPRDGQPHPAVIPILSTCRTRAGSSAKIRTWAAAHEAHVTTFHSTNARVRSAR